MAVERVVAGVDHGAGKPAAVEAHRGIEDFLRRLDPVDLARGLRPETLRVRQRAGMDLVIAAFVVDVHGSVPRQKPCTLMPGLVIGQARGGPDQAGTRSPDLVSTGPTARVDRHHARSVRMDRIEPVQPLLHRLAQIVAAAAERGIAPVDEIALLPGQRQRGPMAVASASAITRRNTSLMLRSSWARPDRAQIAFSTGRLAVAQLKLGRFFWNPARRAARSPARSARGFGRGLVGGIEADGFGIVLQRPGAIALLAPGRAAVVPGALEFRIEFEGRSHNPRSHGRKSFCA